jgi:tRNA pseudouridine55 synthase
MFGVLNIHKPSGMTSHDVVDRCRRVLGTRKIGHLGTLDPMATGVLPICVGTATRLIEYFPSDKTYVGTITFGQTTDSWDADGVVLTEQPTNQLTNGHIAEALTAFNGVIEQTIPLRSAKHIRGKKLYQYAIEGKTLELPTKQVTIHGIHIVQGIDQSQTYPTLQLEVSCSTGTYIRSIAHTLGQLVGTGAHLSQLVRTRHGEFLLADSVPLEALQPDTPLLSPLPYITLPQLPITEPDVWLAIQHGKKQCQAEAFPQHPVKTNHHYLATVTLPDHTVSPAAILLAEDRYTLKPVKVLSHAF